MPRYFFHLVGEIPLQDEEGEDHATLAQALAHARQVAYELARNGTGGKYENVSILVMDGKGRELYEARVTDARDPSGPSQP
jgi:hypothetical protein